MDQLRGNIKTFNSALYQEKDTQHFESALANINRCQTLTALLQNYATRVKEAHVEPNSRKKHSKFVTLLNNMIERIVTERDTLYEEFAVIINDISLTRCVENHQWICAKCEHKYSRSIFNDRVTFVKHILMEMKIDIVEEISQQAIIGFKFKPNSPFKIPSLRQTLERLKVTQTISGIEKDYFERADRASPEKTLFDLWLLCINKKLYPLFEKFSELLNNSYTLTVQKLEMEFFQYVLSTQSCEGGEITQEETNRAIAGINLDEELDIFKPSNWQEEPNVENEAKSTISIRKKKLEESKEEFTSSKSKKKKKEQKEETNKEANIVCLSEQTLHLLKAAGFIDANECGNNMIVIAPQQEETGEEEGGKKKKKEKLKEKEKKEKTTKPDRQKRFSLDILHETMDKLRETYNESGKQRAETVRLYIEAMQQDFQANGKPKLNNPPEYLKSVVEPFNVVSVLLYSFLSKEENFKKEIFCSKEKVESAWKICVEQKAKTVFRNTDVESQVVNAVIKQKISQDMVLKLTLLLQRYIGRLCGRLFKQNVVTLRPLVLKAEALISYMGYTDNLKFDETSSIQNVYQDVSDDLRKCTPAANEFQVMFYYYHCSKLFRTVQLNNSYWEALELTLNNTNFPIHALCSKTLSDAKLINMLKAIWFRLIHAIVYSTKFKIDGSGWTWENVSAAIKSADFRCDFPDILESSFDELENLF